jgi:sporulation protein YlmC with PRC-barrel domain
MKKLVAAASVLSVVGFLCATVAFAQPGTSSEKNIEPSQAQPRATPPADQPGEKTSPGIRAMSSNSKELFASSLIGASVKDPQGQNVGKVEELVIDPQESRIKEAIVSVGGFLGIGAKSVAVPWNDVKPGPDGDTVAIAMGKDELDKAPSWQKPEKETKQTPPATSPPLGPTPGTPGRPQ